MNKSNDSSQNIHFSERRLGRRFISIYVETLVRSSCFVRLMAKLFFIEIANELASALH